MGDKGRQDPRKGGTPSHKGKQEGVQWETRGDKILRKVDTPSNKGKQEGVQWETRGDKTLRKADTPSNKGKQEGVQWETKGDKTLGKANKQQREIRRGTVGGKGRQDPRKGGHTIQHQGGHLKIALRSPNITRFGEICKFKPAKMRTWASTMEDLVDLTNE